MATTTSNVIRANQLLLQKQRERLTINSITISGTTVTITVTNDGTQPIILVAYIIRNNTVKIVGKITPEKYVASETRASLTITTKQPLTPTATYEITLISKLGNAFKATYPIPTTNATTLPGIQATLANTYLPRTAGPGTVTWAGTAIIPTPQTRAGNVSGTATPTNQPTNLNYTDNQNITITPTATYLIKLERRTAIFYDDFQNNPFTDGNLTIINGTWIWNPTGHYIEQTDPYSAEYLVEASLLTQINPLTTSVWALVKTNVTNVEGYIFIYRAGTAGVSFINSTYRYEAGELCTEYGVPWFLLRVKYASIVDPAGNIVNLSSRISTSSQPNLDEWFWILAGMKPSGYLNVTLYGLGGNYLTSTSFVDTYLRPISIGLSTMYSSVAFDDLIIVANATPLFTNFTGVPPGFNVTIYNATGFKVGSGVAGANGVVSVDVITQPIIRNGNVTLYDATGRKVASYVFPVIVGGDVFSVAPKYVASLEVRTQVDLSGTVSVSGSNVSSVSVGLALQSSSSATNFTVYAYDWSLGSFVKVYSGRYVAYLNVTGLPSSLVNPNNGSVILRLIAYDDLTFTLEVNCLNAFPAVWVPLSQDVLIVGDGGTAYVDVLKLSGVVPGSVALSYWESLITSGNVFNGSADITYDDFVTHALILVNGSGVFMLNLLNPSSPPSLITSACRASPYGGVRAEVVHDSVSGKTYLVVLPGVGNRSFCIYNLTAYPSGEAWLISFAPRGLNVSSLYTVSAVVGDSVYTVLQNTTSKAAVLVAVNPFTNSTFIPPSNTANFMPGLNNVGLAYDGRYLWLMLEGGSLYKVSPTYANFTNVPVLLLPAPLGYGDRMEYYNGALILIRDSGSSEVWVIPTS